MKYFFSFFVFLFSYVLIYSQDSCEFNFIKDTIRIPKENKVVDGDYLIATLKNGSTVQLVKTSTNKFYLRIESSENLYFGKTDVLEIKSGTKSFFAKETTNFGLTKYRGYYVIEVFKNYIGTLKEDGITGFVFGKAVTVFTKQDCSQIKKMSNYFYESFCTKNNKK